MLAAATSLFYHFPGNHQAAQELLIGGQAEGKVIWGNVCLLCPSSASRAPLTSGFLTHLLSPHHVHRWEGPPPSEAVRWGWAGGAPRAEACGGTGRGPPWQQAGR